MKRILFFAIAVLITLHSNAQFSYSFSAISGTYTANSSPTSIHGASVDDALSAAINIGFTFQYGCTNYTQFKASSNGVLFLGNGATGTNATNDLSGSTDRPAIAPLWDDLKTDGTGSVNYKLTGTSPNLVLTVEWKQMLWTYSGTSQAISFQAKLYQTTNVIEFVYSRNGTATANITSGASASIGISSTTSGVFYSLDGTGTAPNAVYGTETTTLNTKPATGQIYRWTPVQCSGTPASGTVTASPSALCAAGTSTLTLSGLTGCGFSYQWQSSANGTSGWSNITGATSSTQTVSVPSGGQYYQCVVTCSNSGLSTNSATTNVTVSAPSNNACASAISLGTVSTTTTTTGTNVCGTADQTSPSCHTYAENVWYTFTVPSGGGSYSVSVNAGTMSYPTIAVYSGSCGSFTELGCNLGGSTSSSVIVNCLAAGTYYVAVDEDFGSAGTFSITVAQISSGASAAANNPCSGAISLGTVSTTTTTTGTNSCATADQTSPSCHTYAENVWYTFTVPAGGGTYSITASANTMTYPTIAVFSGSCGALTQIGCDLGSSSSSSLALRCLAAGTYYISVDEDLGTTGTFSLTVTQTSAGASVPSNNACASATSLGSVSTSTTVAGTTDCATSDQTSPSCFTYDQNVWYTFTVPTGGGSYDVKVTGTTLYYPAVSVFSGSCGSFTLINCNGGTITSAVVSANCLAAGTYYIAVDDDLGSPGTFSLTITQTNSGTSAPSNNNCSGAISMTVGSCVAGTGACATQSQAGCVGTANDDVWYKFSATATAMNISVYASSSYDPVVQLFSGSCTSLTSVFCDDATFTTGDYCCKKVTGLTVGSTYYYRVYDYGTGTPATTSFTTCVSVDPTYNCNLNYSYSTITNSQDAGVTASVPGLRDDYLSDAVSLGFAFCFDGFMYSRVYISSNGSLVFDAVDPCVPNVDQSRVAAASSVATGYTIAGPIPTTTDYAPQNAILGPWHDIDPSKGGTITYATLGSSPNRRFVVSFNAVKQFESSSPCQNTSYDYTGQIKLYETTNDVEIHVQQMNSCTSWNNGQAILGLHNAYGTLAVVPTGYNANSSSPYNVYSITNQAWRFSTSCTSCSIILPVGLLEFTASPLDNTSNLIKWTTSKEDDVKFFHVERSLDGTHFQETGLRYPVGPNGASYQFVDYIKDMRQTWYYRLATEDRNGKVEYSGIRVVSRDHNSLAVRDVYPNPFSEELNLDLDSRLDQQITLEIYDVLGKKIFEQNLTVTNGVNSVRVNTFTEPKGLYLVRVLDLTGAELFTKKMVRQ